MYTLQENHGEMTEIAQIENQGKHKKSQEITEMECRILKLQVMMEKKLRLWVMLLALRCSW